MRKFLLVPVLALAATAAHADGGADTNIYAGAGITSANVQNIQGTGFDIDNTSVKALAGVRFMSLVGAEVDYYRLGSESRSFYFGGANADAHAFAAYAVGYLPIPAPNIDVYGKAGLARWQFNGNISQPGLFAVSDNGTDFAWGAGLQVHFLERFAARIEYEHFNIRDADDVQVYSLGVSYTIL